MIWVIGIVVWAALLLMTIALVSAGKDNRREF